MGGVGLWQVTSLIAATMLIFNPENHTGTFGRIFSLLKAAIPVELEWFFTLELMLLAGISLGLLISSVSKSINQATLLMFPAMLIQILLAGLLFDVGKLSWLSFTHWGLQALGNSLNLEYLFEAAGKASDPILDKLNFSGDALALTASWLVLVCFIASLLALTCWRQRGRDKAQIPED